MTLPFWSTEATVTLEAKVWGGAASRGAKATTARAESRNITKRSMKRLDPPLPSREAIDSNQVDLEGEKDARDAMSITVTIPKANGADTQREGRSCLVSITQT